NTENRSIFYKPFNPESPHFNEAYYEEWKANAKLIAAAPELLESLQELKKHANLTSHQYKLIDNVIKKATS
ncbi:MAG: hypothetical protein GY739_15985, partial [Mesoflavibacter sp.]|nr:hypothetical protein [Mesoflavibacter sp.]